MGEDSRRVLDLLAQGKITVDEADQLLRAIEEARGDRASAPKPGDGQPPRYFRIAVARQATGWRPEKLVNIRVPIALVKSGMRLGAVIPGLASDEILRRLRERGIAIDFASLDQARIDELVKNFGELNFDIDSGHAKVRITCE